MNDVLVDVRKYDLADRLKMDFISVDNLLNKLEEALDEIDALKEKIKELNTPTDEDIDGRMYDKWMGIL